MSDVKRLDVADIKLDDSTCEDETLVHAKRHDIHGGSEWALLHGYIPDHTNGTTALMQAVENENVVIVQQLLTNVSELHCGTNNGRTALMIAAGNGNRPILELLLEARVDVNSTDINGRSALQYVTVPKETAITHRSTDHKWINCLKLLLINGQNTSLDIKDESGRALMQSVMDTEQADLIWYLVTENCSLRGLDLKVDKHKFNFVDLLKLGQILFESGTPQCHVEMIFSETFENLTPDEREIIEKQWKWKSEEFQTFCRTRTLKTRCRREIRKSIGPGIRSKIGHIGLPKPLEDFILMKDIIPEAYFKLTLKDEDDTVIPVTDSKGQMISWFGLGYKLSRFYNECV
ncbi:hypothetical protein SNE40_010956 [Patella caerulea]|uniref:SOCS box domain-containing protein n=1 Tax=Patella caerulea TaxID=87958 RepID=A0AAN8Q5Q7_PATCE